MTSITKSINYEVKLEQCTRCNNMVEELTSDGFCFNCDSELITIENQLIIKIQNKEQEERDHQMICSKCKHENVCNGESKDNDLCRWCLYGA